MAVQDLLLGSASLGQLYQLGSAEAYIGQVQTLTQLDVTAHETLVVPVGWPTAGWQGRDKDGIIELHYIVRYGFASSTVDLAHPLLAVAWQYAHVDPRLTVISAILDEQIRRGIEEGTWLQAPTLTEIMNWIEDPELRAFRVVDVNDAATKLADLVCMPGVRAQRWFSHEERLWIDDASRRIPLGSPTSHILYRAIGMTIGDLLNDTREVVVAPSDVDPAEVERMLQRMVVTSVMLGMALGVLILVEP